MRRAWLLHGTGGSDTDYFWFSDTSQYLAAQDYEVWWPLLPHTEKPNLQETLEYIESNMPEPNEETVIIGHSSACPVILHMLESFRVRIKQAILISGFYQSLHDDGYSDLMLPQEGFKFNEAKKHTKEIILINSDNDPWGCTDTQARPVAIALDAPLILTPGQGHMGSGAYNQPYREFPLLERLLAV
jgi:predicted alpha/beta hydrolase family esterase